VGINHAGGGGGSYCNCLEICSNSLCITPPSPPEISLHANKSIKFPISEDYIKHLHYGLCFSVTERKWYQNLSFSDIPPPGINSEHFGNIGFCKSQQIWRLIALLFQLNLSELHLKITISVYLHDHLLQQWNA